MTVVSTIVELVAGSWPSRLIMIGMNAPAIPAIVIDATIARPITSARPGDLLHRYTASDVTSATPSPFSSPRHHFLAQYTQPRVDADLAQREAPHRHRECLRARVAGLTGDDRHQHRERRELRDRVLEQADDGRGEERGQQIELQPRMALSDRGPHRRQRVLVLAGADHRLQVGQRVLLDRVEQVFAADEAGKASLQIHDRQRVDVVPADARGDFFARREFVDVPFHGSHQRADARIGRRRDQALQIDRADQQIVRVDDEQRAGQARLAVLHAFETLGDVRLRRDVQRLNFHQRGGGTFAHAQDALGFALHGRRQ